MLLNAIDAIHVLSIWQLNIQDIGLNCVINIQIRGKDW